MTALLEIDGLAVDIPLAAGTLHAVRDVSLSRSEERRVG